MVVHQILVLIQGLKTLNISSISDISFSLSMSISWLNALFFNFCVYKSDQSPVLVEIIKDVLYRESRVWFLITVRCPYVPQPIHFVETFDDLEKISQVFYPLEYSMDKNNNTQSLYIVDRFVILPRITYRKAL